MGSKGGAVVRALASHQCGPGSNPGVDAICGLSLLLVLSFAPRGFSPGSLPSKTSISKFLFDQESGRRRTTMWMCYLLIVILFIYSLIDWLIDWLIYLFSVSPPGLTASRVWDNLYNSKFPAQFCTNLGKKSFFQTWLWPKSLGDVSVGRCSRNVSASALWLDL